jgi:hypothetical protein
MNDMNIDTELSCVISGCDVNQRNVYWYEAMDHKGENTFTGTEKVSNLSLKTLAALPHSLLSRKCPIYH